MQLYNIYFSPTGGTKKVADALCKEISSECSVIDILPPKDYTKQFSKDDVCVFTLPSFGGRAPAIAVQRLKQMKADGTRAVIVAVYGNRDYEDTLIEMKDTLTQQGFAVIGAVSAVAQHSMMADYGANRPDSEDLKELAQFGAKLKAKLESGDMSEAVVKGNHPYKEFGGLPLKPKANSKCTKCGQCVANCPTQAIPAENPNETDTSKCITCMQCAAVCPNGARNLPAPALTMIKMALKKACSERKNNEIIL